MSFIVIIPARAASVRLPGKPLLDLGGKPMVVRTAEQASRSHAQRVVVATDCQEICDIVRKHGFEARLTRDDHATGTDRLAEVADQLSLADQDIVVNVQGDEPLIDPANINAVATLLREAQDASIATCATPITDAQTLFNPNAVKVVCNRHHRALYFSRAPIPWARDALADSSQKLAGGLPALLHIGLYAYRVDFLRAFRELQAGPLEKFESLEQLRALENGFEIAVSTTNTQPQPGVDTHEDLLRIRNVLANRL